MLRTIPAVLNGLALSIALLPDLSATVGASPLHLTLAHNIATVPDQLSSSPSPCNFCHHNNDFACTNYVLEALNHARAIEGVPATTRPANWHTLTTPEQLFVLADLDARGRTTSTWDVTTPSARAPSLAPYPADSNVASEFPIARSPSSVLLFGDSGSSGWSPVINEFGCRLIGFVAQYLSGDVTDRLQAWG